MFSQYSSALEEKLRFELFQKRLANIDELNARERVRRSGTVHGITIFSDLTDHEFRTRQLGNKPSDPDTFDTFSKTVEPMMYRGAVKEVDWTGIYTTPVKNQGQCGSSW